MRYFITAVFASIALCLSLVLAFSVYLGFTDGAAWWLVSLGIFCSNVVSVLITTASYSAAKDY